MPIEYTVYSGTALARCHGVVTGRDVKNLLAEYVSDPRLSRPHRELFDVRNVDKYELRGNDVRMVTDFARSTGDRFHGGRVAFVASQDMVFGMGRMLGVFAEMVNVELHAFRRIEEACAWLGLPIEAVDDHEKNKA